MSSQSSKYSSKYSTLKTIVFPDHIKQIGGESEPI